MAAGKFIPGGQRKNDGEAIRPGPIRAPSEEDNSAEPTRKVFAKTQSLGKPSAGGAGGGRPPNKKGGSGLGKFLPNFRAWKPSLTLISCALCCVFVSLGWYYLYYLPAYAQSLALQEQLKKAAADLAQQQVDAQKHLQAVLDAQAHATGILTIDSDPSNAPITISGRSLKTPVEIKDFPPGPVQIDINLEGYEPYSHADTVVANQTLALGKIVLVRKIGALQVTSNRSTATFILTGPNDFSKNGTLPANFSDLWEGTYSLTAQDHDWTLPPISVTIHDKETGKIDVHFPYVNLTINSTPPGATVKEGRVSLGQTPVTLTDQHPAHRDFTLDLPLYKVEHLSLDLPAEGGDINKTVALTHNQDRVNSIGMPLAWIPSGYWVGKYEVRQTDYETVMQSNPSSFRKPFRPVETVSWNDAVDFCKKLTQLEAAAGTLPAGYHYSLPTESQWSEYNADANIDTAATSRIENLSGTEEVGYSEPNQFGLYDTLGNVWEWCQDTFGPQDDYHSMRGGSWLSSTTSFANADVRNGAPATYRDRFTGFRVVLEKNSPP